MFHRLIDLVSPGLTAIAAMANAIGTIVVLILVLVLDVDVIARGVFSSPFHGVFEVVQYSMVLIVFLQLPDVVRVNRITRSDGLLTILGNAYPGIGRFIARCIDAVAAVMMALIAITMWPEFVEAWHTDHFFGTPGIFTAPWWPVRLIIVFSATLCALIWATKVVTGRRILGREPMTSPQSEAS